MVYPHRAYFSRPLKSYTKKAEEYQACLITIIYGETYLDPEKFKARSFDLIKAIEERHDCPGSGLIGQQMRKDFALCSRNLLIKHKLYAKVVAVKTNDDELYSERFGL
ncbi:9138_t:CDS:2 [Funneliformis caledonium]|uniref:9138_t:CDS:1 n=1 Tax=Funneliformis caledonium TaxID=1117310 RepID=A0A9N8WGR7_9GLOM|nr:9138_t:CDS:2 [Funneliformis caledonium]